jgi:arsenate reductase
MKLHLYHYPNCSTCRKARSWLDGHGIAYTHSDLVASPIPLATLRDLHKRAALPIARLFNTSGVSYREGNFKDKSKRMSDAELLAALAADGKLVKRPILDAGSFVLIGFDPERYAEKLG